VERKNFLLEQLLQEYLPSDAAEQEYKEIILNFLLQYPDAFEALLTHHKKLNKWLQLGGHCDGNVDALAVAIKEAQEESGIMEIEPVQTTIFDISVHLIPENKKEKAHYHYDIRFLLQVMSDEKVVVSDESHDLAWINKNKDALPTRERSVTRMFDKWLSLSIMLAH